LLYFFNRFFVFTDYKYGEHLIIFIFITFKAFLPLRISNDFSFTTSGKIPKTITSEEKGGEFSKQTGGIKIFALLLL